MKTRFVGRLGSARGERRRNGLPRSRRAQVLFAALGALLVVVLGLHGCSADAPPPKGAPDGGTDNDAGGIPGLVSLTIDPPTAALTMDYGTSAGQAFTARGTFVDGTSRDVTGEVGWSIKDMTTGGSVTGGEFNAFTPGSRRWRGRARATR